MKQEDLQRRRNTDETDPRLCLQLFFDGAQEIRRRQHPDDGAVGCDRQVPDPLFLHEGPRVPPKSCPLGKRAGLVSAQEAMLQDAIRRTLPLIGS